MNKIADVSKLLSFLDQLSFLGSSRILQSFVCLTTSVRFKLSCGCGGPFAADFKEGVGRSNEEDTEEDSRDGDAEMC